MYGRGPEFACEKEPQDLARALSDLEHFRIAVEASHGELLGVAVSTMDLHGLACAHVRDITGAQFRGGGGRRVRPTFVLEPGGVPGEQTRRLDRDPHVGELERDPLVRADRAAEGLPIAR